MNGINRYFELITPEIAVLHTSTSLSDEFPAASEERCETSNKGTKTNIT